eukprot:TRINITY_DN13433_c0_g1_i8.p1 TRINITY_DN13433_c0_g1~~TRINITY_DN13433_c0_g1_i8.p1  ORF type:complete len:560 (+),score=193.58 TRINITY_DN13433_c0_g1_i8:448-2127(+)
MCSRQINLQANPPQSTNQGFETVSKEVVRKFRSQVLQRGPSGLLNFARHLKMNADRRTGNLSARDFVAAIKDLRFDLSIGDIERLFEVYDTDGDGRATFEDIVYTVRGSVDNTRKNLLTQLFDILDRSKSSLISVDSVRARFDGGRHPDVIAGRRSAEEVIAEFMQLLDGYQQFKDIRDYTLTFEEFIDFYTFITIHIEDNTTFVNQLNGTFKMGEVVRSALQQQQPLISSPPRSQVNEKFSPQSQAWSPPQGGNSDEKRSVGGGRLLELLISRLRALIAGRGPRGLLGLERQLRVLDLNCDNLLEASELRKALKDFRLELTENEFATLFTSFDTQRKGLFDYISFFSALLGSFSSARREVVAQLAEKLDPHGSGSIAISDLKNNFSPRLHPDVKSGRRSEESVLLEFIESIDQFLALKVGTVTALSRDQLEDFLSYFSAVVLDDKLFETIFSTTFRLISENPRRQVYAGIAGGRKDFNPRAGYLQDFHRGIYSGGSVAQNAPFGTSDGKVDYSTAMRPKTTESRQGGLNVPAGIATWSGALEQPRGVQKAVVSITSSK